MRTNGKAVFKSNIDEYIGWYEQLSYSEAQSLRESLMEAYKKENPEYNPYKGSNEAEAIRKAFSLTCGYISGQEEKKWNSEEGKGKTIDRLRRYKDFATDMEQQLSVGAWVEGSFAYLYLGNPSGGIIITEPEKYLEYIPEKEYNNLTAAEVRQLLGAPAEPQGGSLIAAGAENCLTVSGLNEQLDYSKSELEDLMKEIDDTQHHRTGELAELQKQMDAIKATLEEKKQALMAELNEKKAELEAKKEQMENQIYLLDSQIYAIRCYAGEVVNFAKIRSGKQAPIDEPIVVHQKIRFLDEDLGRLASIYTLKWERVNVFEEFLKHSPLALETFAPDERCVTLVRLSRSGTKIGRTDMPYSNMLEDYEYYHGRTVGIIIRNGENVYLGWTDEKRVHIEDDLIVSQVIRTVEPAEEKKYTFESDRQRAIEREKLERKKIVDGIISRNFVYNILQGIIDNTPLLPLPKGVKLNKQSPYVIYAVADKWLSDNRFGSFDDIIKETNSVIKEGDMLLTVQHLTPQEYTGFSKHAYGTGKWENPRGRGERNRTHDCSVDDCTLYPVNLIEYEKPVNNTEYICKTNERWFYKDGVVHSSVETEKFEKYIEGFSSSVNAEGHTVYTAPANHKTKHGIDGAFEYEVLRTYDTQEKHIFVSVEKDGENWWRADPPATTARANFELYNGEYINLTYLNSVVLEWVISNKKLGGWTVGGKSVDYAYAIRYLKTAMDYIRKREEEEMAILNAVDESICKDKEWPLKLSKWKMEKGVRKITEYQAKRFAKRSSAKGD